MKKYHFLAIALLLFGSTSLLAQLEWINFDQGSTILDMDQDGDDIWIGSYGGAVRLNRTTKEKTIYQAWNSPLQIKSIQNVLVDGFGNRWFSSSEQGLSVFNSNDQWILYDEYNGSALLDVDNLSPDFSGGVWFTARYPFELNYRVFHYNGVSFEDHPIATLQNNLGVREMDYTSTGSVWTNDSREIRKYNQVSIVKTYNHLFFGLSSSARFLHLTIDGDEDIWVYSFEDNSIYKLDEITGAWEVKFNDPDETPRDIFLDENENLWIDVQYLDPNTGFSRRKYYKREGEDWIEYFPADFGQLISPNGVATLHFIDSNDEGWLTQNIANQAYPQLLRSTSTEAVSYNHPIFPNTTFTTKDLVLDCDQLYWFMDNREIKRFDGSDWEKLDISSGNGSFQALAKSKNRCDIWIGISSSGDPDVIQYNDGIINSFDLDHGRLSDIEINGNVVWASTHNYLAKYQDSEWDYFSYLPDSSNYYIEQIEVDLAGNVWGSYSSLNRVFQFDGTNFTEFDEDNSLIDDDIDWFYSDRDGTMWMGNQKTYKYRNNTWSIHPFPFSSGITGMDQDADGNYWISHNSEGLIFWNGDDIFAFYNIVNSDIATNRNLTVKVDPYGNKWVRQLRGTTFFNQNGLSFDHLPNSISIGGRVFLDANQNGIFDIGIDFGKSGEIVTLLPDNINTFTDQNGFYSFNPAPGNYEIVHDANGIYFPTSNESITVDFSHASINDQDFGMWSNNFPEEVVVKITPGYINCEEDVAIVVDIENDRLNPVDGTVELSFPDDFDFTTGVPNNYQINGNTASWDFLDLAPQQSLRFKIFVKAPGSASAGNSYNFETSVDVFSNNQLVEEASDETSAIVNCNDPSLNKRSEATGPSLGAQTLIQDPLNYIIEFQNNQLETVSLLKIVDSLSSKFDLSTFSVLAASHPVNTNITSDGVIEFLFSDIDLPSANSDPTGSQGFVKFQIKAKQMAPPIAIQNKAYLYFDFYPVIKTNSTNNVFVDILNATNQPNEVSFDAEIFPNPNEGSFAINLLHENRNQKWQARLIDVSGKTVRQFDSNQAIYYLENLTAGFYFLEIQIEQERLSKKVVVYNQ